MSCTFVFPISEFVRATGRRRKFEKVDIIHLILIIALNLAGCSNRNVNRNLQNKPDITGTVLEVQDNSILLEINKEGYPDGTRCKVSLNEKNRDNYAEVSVGDEVVVYYDGKIAESDPLQINTVYGITLKNSVD